MSVTLKPAPTPAPRALPTNPADADAIITAVERLSGYQALTIAGARGEAAVCAILPTGKRVESLKPLLEQFAFAPDRISGMATLRDEASFVAHVRAMKEPTTAIFADPDFGKPSLTAVYDYHAVSTEELQLPNFCVHRALWPLTLSKEWTAWANQSGKAQSPTDFAEFLERHVPDVYWGDLMSDYTKQLIAQLELRLATPSQLIALSRNMQVNVDASVKQAQTLSSGEIAIVYVETHNDGEGQPIRVPNAFLIAIPVIQGGPTYQLLVRLRYRLASGKVSWFFELHRADVVFDAAVQEICTRVASETGRPVYLGSPEK